MTYKTVVRKSQNQRRYPAERMRELIQQTLERVEQVKKDGYEIFLIDESLFAAQDF